MTVMEVQEVSTAKQLREKWADELEFGNHSQANCVLKDTYGGYCCLGVAAEHVLGKEFIPSDDGDELYYIGEDGNKNIAFLEKADAALLGIDGDPTPEQRKIIEEMTDLTVGIRSLQNVFASLNDDFVQHKSFSDIAKVVRAID